MAGFQIGVLVDSFKAGLTEGIHKAKELGVTGIQVSAVQGETAPENLNAAQRKAILDHVR